MNSLHRAKQKFCYFETGDEEQRLGPMILKDITEEIRDGWIPLYRGWPAANMATDDL